MTTKIDPVLHEHGMRIHRLRQCPETELTDADLESIAYASSDWWVRRIATELLRRRGNRRAGEAQP
jgi:hypothetical protein